jgi:hypothetical protein
VVGSNLQFSFCNFHFAIPGQPTTDHGHLTKSRSLLATCYLLLLLCITSQDEKCSPLSSGFRRRLPHAAPGRRPNYLRAR